MHSDAFYDFVRRREWELALWGGPAGGVAGEEPLRLRADDRPQLGRGSREAAEGLMALAVISVCLAALALVVGAAEVAEWVSR